ncbi:hypothetical protein EV421DRAFT_1743181 [Armillaria borealis]|uniref:Uncharacterized protein n=1 Tax=Armillaria borealis TaxID=47425 RepID=A0AA39IVP7_9AGAR|nr:hypothetical protein EV421DRAFT_1743181 [Armillaria borealis]
MYYKLPNSEKSAWEELAVEEHEIVTKEYEEKLKAPISKDPKNLQERILLHGSIIETIMQYVLKLLIDIIEAERANFKRFILLIYGNFIKKCFTNTPTLKSIGFASEADGIALHTIEGELYNTAEDLEEMPAVEAFTKKMKTLREPPVKKKPDVLKEKTGSEDEAAVTNTAEKTKEPKVSIELAKGSLMGPLEPEPDKSASNTLESLTEGRKSLLSAASQPSSPGLPANQSPLPRDPGREPALCPLVSPVVSRASSPSRSRPLSSVMLRANSVMVELSGNTPAGRKRGADGVEPEQEEPACHKEKRPCKELATNSESSAQGKSILEPFNDSASPAVNNPPKLKLPAIKSDVDPVKEFETKFWMWWSQLQPKYHAQDKSNVMLLIGEDGHPDGHSKGSWKAL